MCFTTGLHGKWRTLIIFKLNWNSCTNKHLHMKCVCDKQRAGGNFLFISKNWNPSCRGTEEFILFVVKFKEVNSVDSNLDHYFPILCTTQSCWHSGHLLFCFVQSVIQQLWNEWLHSPQTTTQSSCLFSDWHRRHASITWTLQIAQVSHSTSQLHIATRFHFLRVNILSVFWFASLSTSISSAIFVVFDNAIITN